MGVGPFEVLRAPPAVVEIEFIHRSAGLRVLIEEGGQGRNLAVRAGRVDIGHAVVEEEELGEVGVARIDAETIAPVDVVLVEQALVRAVPAVVGRRIAPAVDDVPVEEATVPDDPDFVEGRDAHDDLVDVGVGPIVDGVHVEPVGGLVAERAVVEVDAALVVGHDAEVGLGAVEVLDEVVPGAPFPDDVRAAHAVGLKLDELVTPQLAAGEQGRVAAILDALEAVEDLPADGDDVATRRDGEIVVQPQAVVVGAEAPQDVVVPGAALDRRATAAGPDGVVADGGRPGGHDDVPVFLQVGGVAGAPVLGHGPVVDDLAASVQQHRPVLVVRVDHRVPFRVEVGIVSNGADGVLCGQGARQEEGKKQGKQAWGHGRCGMREQGRQC